MTTDQIILFALFGTVFACLLWGRFRYDLVAFTALMLGVVLGVVPAAAECAALTTDQTAIIVDGRIVGYRGP